MIRQGHQSVASYASFSMSPDLFVPPLPKSSRAALSFHLVSIRQAPLNRTDPNRPVFSERARCGWPRRVCAGGGDSLRSRDCANTGSQEGCDRSARHHGRPPAGIASGYYCGTGWKAERAGTGGIGVATGVLRRRARTLVGATAQNRPIGHTDVPKALQIRLVMIHYILGTGTSRWLTEHAAEETLGWHIPIEQ